MNNVHVGWGPVGLTTILSNKQTKLRLNKSSVSLEKGGSFKIEVLSNYVDSLIWESSNPDVAVVDDEGNVTVMGYGTAKITVTSGELKGSCTITVKKEPVINPPVEPDEPVVPEEPENKLDNTKMYYGIIPDTDQSILSFSDITEDIIYNAYKQGLLKEAAFEPGEYEIQSEAEHIIFVALPGEMYRAKQLIQGTYLGFSDSSSGLSIHANGLELGNFYLYGEIDLVGTGKTIISIG